MLKVYCIESGVVASTFTNEFGSHVVGESYLLISKETMPTIQGQMQFESVALLSLPSLPP